jgi:hypothetical protein
LSPTFRADLVERYRTALRAAGFEPALAAQAGDLLARLLGRIRVGRRPAAPRGARRAANGHGTP